MSYDDDDDDDELVITRSATNTAVVLGVNSKSELCVKRANNAFVETDGDSR